MATCGVCLCFKDSATYLAEWLAYYRAIGVERFYLYDNGSTDDYRKIVNPYVKKGLARLVEWEGRAQQGAIYQDCLRVAKEEGTKWVAFVDDDEFIVPVLDRDLPRAMRRFGAHAGVAACWQLFGSSNHEKRPSGLVIENFTRRSSPPREVHVKCVVAPERVLSPREIGHSFNCVEGYKVVDEHGKPIDTALHYAPTGDILRINHYVTKSIEELRLRRQRPRADSGVVSEHSLEQWEQWAKEWNDYEDREILKFLPKVKEGLSKFEPNPPLWRRLFR